MPTYKYKWKHHYSRLLYITLQISMREVVKRSISLSDGNHCLSVCPNRHSLFGRRHRIIDLRSSPLLSCATTNLKLDEHLLQINNSLIRNACVSMLKTGEDTRLWSTVEIKSLINVKERKGRRIFSYFKMESSEYYIVK